MAKKEEKKKDISLSIIDIQETSFKFNSEYDYSEFSDKNLSIGFGQKFQIDPDNNKFGIEVSIFYVDTRNNTHLSELSVHFNFLVSELNSFIEVQEDGFKTKENDLILNLMNVAIGTMRGIFYLELKGTPLGKYPLPLIPTSFFENISGTKK